MPSIWPCCSGFNAFLTIVTGILQTTDDWMLRLALFDLYGKPSIHRSTIYGSSSPARRSSRTRGFHAPGPWAKPASIGFRHTVARCCKIGSRPNPDRAAERQVAREGFHEGEDGCRYGRHL